MEIQDPTLPVDPNAPTRHTLPSGRVVEARSHRTLLGSDGDAVIAAQTGVGARGTVDMRNELIARMVTQIEPGKSAAPDLDGTVATVLAQRLDDYRTLYGLVTDGWLLVTGLSVIPDEEAWEDPTVPTKDGPDPGPPSAVEDPS